MIMLAIDAASMKRLAGEREHRERLAAVRTHGLRFDDPADSPASFGWLSWFRSHAA